jgi:hypothetical protein
MNSPIANQYILASNMRKPAAVTGRSVVVWPVGVPVPVPVDPRGNDPVGTEDILKGCVPVTFVRDARLTSGEIMALVEVEVDRDAKCDVCKLVSWQISLERLDMGWPSH